MTMNLDQKLRALEAEAEMKRLAANYGKDVVADKEKALAIIYVLKVVFWMAVAVGGFFVAIYFIGQVVELLTTPPKGMPVWVWVLIWLVLFVGGATFYLGFGKMITPRKK